MLDVAIRLALLYNKAQLLEKYVVKALKADYPLKIFNYIKEFLDIVFNSASSII